MVFLSITFTPNMKRHIYRTRDLLIPLIDYFHPPFRRFMTRETFRYAACGGLNMFLGYVVYYISFKFLLREQTFDLGFYALKAHVAALFFSCSSGLCAPRSSVSSTASGTPESGSRRLAIGIASVQPF